MYRIITIEVQAIRASKHSLCPSPRARTSIVMIRYILLVYIVSRKSVAGASVGPLYQLLAQQHLEMVVVNLLVDRIRQVFMMSSQILGDRNSTENFLYIFDIIETAIPMLPVKRCATL